MINMRWRFEAPPQTPPKPLFEKRGFGFPKNFYCRKRTFSEKKKQFEVWMPQTAFCVLFLFTVKKYDKDSRQNGDACDDIDDKVPRKRLGLGLGR